MLRSLFDGPREHARSLLTGLMAGASLASLRSMSYLPPPSSIPDAPVAPCNSNTSGTLPARALLRHNETSLDLEEGGRPPASGASSVSGNGRPTPHQISGTFVERLQGCLLDGYCHTIFLHIGKSGGTTLEAALGKFFNPHERVVGARWSCCGDELMERFRAKKMEYCMSPFRPFQLSAGNIAEIVDTCQTIYNELHRGTNNGTRAHYLEVLVSIREPITRELSKIHQMCNKAFHARTKEWQEACRRCSFDKDRDFWLSGTFGTNQPYRQVLSLLSEPGYGRAAIANQTAPLVPLPASVPTYLIDMSDITPFLSELRRNLPTEHAPRLLLEGQRNKESKAMCNFHMPSELMKALSPALDVYRAIVSGTKGKGVIRYTSAEEKGT